MVCSFWTRRHFAQTLNSLIAQDVLTIVATHMYKIYCEEMTKIEHHQVGGIRFMKH